MKMNLIRIEWINITGMHNFTFVGIELGLLWPAAGLYSLQYRRGNKGGDEN
jgi:hypothetical protein